LRGHIADDGGADADHGNGDNKTRIAVHNTWSDGRKNSEKKGRKLGRLRQMFT